MQYTEPQEIVDTVVATFPDKDKKPEPSEIEDTLRQFGIISEQTETRVCTLLRKIDRQDLVDAISPWCEANAVVGPVSASRERRRRVLYQEPNDNVLQYLPEAILHAISYNVSERIKELAREWLERVQSSERETVRQSSA